MYIWLTITAAAAPSMLCFVLSAFLAAKNKGQWGYFAALGFAAGLGAIYVLTH